MRVKLSFLFGAFGFLLCRATGWTQLPEDALTVEMLQSLAESRENTLSSAVTATYSVKYMRLPGKSAWLLQGMANHTIAKAPVDETKEPVLQSFHECKLRLLDSVFSLEISEPRNGHLELNHTDGTLSWLHLPKQNWAQILVTPLTPQNMGVQKPWLPSYLTTFPDSMLGVATGKKALTLGKLLVPSPDKTIEIYPADNGDVVVKIGTAIKSKIQGHELVREVTLGKAVGFAPIHYVAFYRWGADAFPPCIEVRYEDFARAGAVSFPRRIVFVSSDNQQVHGKPGAAEKVSDIQSYQTEELTVAVSDLKLDQSLTAEEFAFKLPPKTTVQDMFAQKQYTTQDPKDAVETLGRELDKAPKVK